MSSEVHTALVIDEVDFFAQALAPQGARVVELGCGKAVFARALLQRGLARTVTAFEVDRTQHAANLAAPPVAGLQFVEGGAQAIALPDASADIVIMLKSLHHVPLDQLDQALAEVRRVLVPGGVLYVSEPVYAGDFNDIVKLFHDEGLVRAAAHAALQRAAAAGVLKGEREVVFDTPLHFRDYDDFVERIVRVTHSDLALPPALDAEVRRLFAPFQGPDGARFVRQMRINFLRKP
ncbi:MAG: class I SAM-dependent methyltransferase [Rubrivivax sp.]|nr:class I SAM-dependent methyltransferase [Rubrivivax sp.]